MNTKLFFTLCASLLLAGGAGAAWAQEVDCEPIKIKDKECQGDRHYPIVTINTVTKKIAPEFICVARDRVIEFRVVPPGKIDFGSVAVKAKDGLNTWLIGANFPSKMRIEVRVPMWIENNEIHHYNIVFEDGTCIDPRVHVQD